MLRINDDSDELFRKAAEHYPLKIDGADWETVRQKLNEWTDEDTAVPEKSKGKRFPFFLLVCAGLMILAPLAVADLIQTAGNYKGQAFTSESPAGSMSMISPASAQKRSGSSIIPVDRPSASAFQSSMISNISANDQKIANTDPNDENKLSVSSDLTPAPKNNSPLTETANSLDDKSPTASVISDKKKEMQDPTVTNNPGKEKKKRNSSFYAGLIAGADLSMVKFQEVRKVGFSAGILAGYQINKRLSIETGLLWDRKNYTTDGKYFSTKNISLPYYSTILYAEGDCNMFELPLNIRYRFAHRSRSNWFVSAGTSSYFMKKESYDYKIMRYNNLYYGSYSYKNSSTNLFAVVNLGAGFEKHLGEKFKLRAEPYVKIPVNKVGIGKLPLQSAGINLGITRSF